MQHRDQRRRSIVPRFPSTFGSILLGFIPGLLVILMAIIENPDCSPVPKPLPLLENILYMSLQVVVCGEVILAVVWLLRKQQRHSGVALLLTHLSNVPLLFLVWLLLFELGFPVFCPR
jgi:hypothetical protein